MLTNLNYGKNERKIIENKQYETLIYFLINQYINILFKSFATLNKFNNS